MELKKITETVFYIPNPSNIGVVKYSDDSCFLVDSGIDDDTGRKVLRLLEENNLSVKAIINTHSHADHCGGNSFIQKRTNAKIYASDTEAEIISSPEIEPLYLFSGASPIKDLKNKFMMAPKSKVNYFISSDKINIDGQDISIVYLPGHSPNQIGVVYDGVLFCADSIFSEETLKKHKIPFFSDIEKTKETLEWLKNSNYDYYIPSHASPSKDISDLADKNLEVISSIENSILEISKEKKSSGQILKQLLYKHDINITAKHQYFLMNTVAMAFLSYLYNNSKLELIIEDNLAFWKS